MADSDKKARGSSGPRGEVRRTAHLGVKITVPEREALRAYAKSSGITMSSLARRLIRRGLKAAGRLEEGV